MEMKLANKESKSILAKLLASENLTVEHGKFNTASFDVKNRILRLPIWKEMKGSLYDLLVLHEVGHALFTPEEGYHDAQGHGKGFKSFLNVVEDARIERTVRDEKRGSYQRRRIQAVEEGDSAKIMVGKYEIEICVDEDGSFYYIDPDSGEEVPCDEDGNPL